MSYTHTPDALRRHIFERFEHIPFGRWPTPVERSERLERELDIGQLWIKRDDLSGELYGGNKTRKLEFCLGRARAQGAQRTMTLGAIGSHHVLATCLYARELGFEPAAQHYPQPITPHVLDNLRALSTTHPELSLVGHPVALSFKLFKRHLRAWLAENPETYFIPGGGSSTVGTIAYVTGALELASQFDAGELPMPHKIFVAAGSLSTLAGLVLGCKMAGLPTRVVGVRVVDRILSNKPNTLRLIRNATRALRREGVRVRDVGVGDFDLLEGYFGEAYGVPTPQGEQAIAMAQDLAGLTLDSTYTGKAFSALRGEGRQGALADERVLYWHTLSSADLSERIAHADVQRDLPEAYHGFFEQPDA